MVREALARLRALGFEVARFAAVPAEALLLAEHLVLDIVGGPGRGVLESACLPGAVRDGFEPLGHLAQAQLASVGGPALE